MKPSNMITRLIKRGDAYFLEIDPALLNELQIDENTLLEVSQLDEGMNVTKAKTGVPRELLDDAIRFAHDNYSETFKKLAE